MIASLAELTWPAVDPTQTPTLVIALGACEQHGPHLPFDTDTVIAEALVARAVAGVAGVIVGPSIPFGASGEHKDFPGTLSLGTEVLSAVLVELARSAIPPFERLVVVNGHGGNGEALRQAAVVARRDGRCFEVWSPCVPGGDGHAGRTETSIMLALDPSRVRTEAIERGNTEPLSALMGKLRRDGVRAHSSNGILGDPTNASAEHGHHVLAALTEDLRYFLAATPEPTP